MSQPWTGIGASRHKDPDARKDFEEINRFLYNISDGLGQITKGKAPTASGPPLGGGGTLTDYLFKPGLPANQLAYGGTGASGFMTLSSTAHSTKGKLYLGSNLTTVVVDEANSRLGINTASPTAVEHVVGAAAVGITARPISTDTFSNWRGQDGGSGSLQNYVNETTLNEGTYVSELPLGAGSGSLLTYRLWNAGGIQFNASASVSLVLRVRRTAGTAPTGLETLRMRIRRSAVLVTDQQTAFLGTAFTTYTYSLSASEVTSLYNAGADDCTLDLNVANLGDTTLCYEIAQITLTATTQASVVVRKLQQTDSAVDCDQWLNSSLTVMSRINPSGAYGLVAGAAVGSLYVCQNATTGVGAWQAPGASTLSLADNLFSLFDNLTPSKIAQFQLSGLSAGTNVFTFPQIAAATFAVLEKAQTFTKAQTITPDSDIDGLTSVIISGGVSNGLAVFDTDGGANIFGVQGLNNAGGSGQPETRVGYGLAIYPSGDITGVARSFLTSNVSSGTKTVTLPNISGTALLRAGATDIGAKIAATGSTSLVAAGQVITGDYQVNAYMACVGAGSAGTATLTIGWTDENGAQTKQLGSVAMNALSTAGGGNPALLVTSVLRAVNTTSLLGRITAISITNGGNTYAVNDLLLIGSGGNGGVVKVTTVAAGVITAISLQGGGSQYSTGTPKASSRLNGAANTSATFNITSIAAAVGITYSVSNSSTDGAYTVSLRVNAV